MAVVYWIDEIYTYHPLKEIGENEQLIPAPSTLEQLDLEEATAKIISEFGADQISKINWSTDYFLTLAVYNNRDEIDHYDYGHAVVPTIYGVDGQVLELSQRIFVGRCPSTQKKTKSGGAKTLEKRLDHTQFVANSGRSASDDQSLNSVATKLRSNRITQSMAAFNNFDSVEYPLPEDAVAEDAVAEATISSEAIAAGKVAAAEEIERYTNELREYTGEVVTRTKVIILADRYGIPRPSRKEIDEFLGISEDDYL